MTPRLTATLALAAVLAFAPRPARADDDSAKNEARALLQGGNKLLENGDRTGALALFTSAYAKFPSPLILINIGTTLRELDRPAEAANAYARFVAAPGEFTDRLPRIRKLLAELDRTLGQIAITIDPADAEISVADAPFTPASSLPRWRVPPGSVVVRAQKSGWVPLEITVAVPRRGKPVAVTLQLSRTPTPDEPPNLTDSLETSESATSADLRAHISYAPPPRFGVAARALIDGRGRGAAGSAGVLVRIHDRVELIGAAIFANPDELTLGVYGGANVELGRGTWRPRLVAGMPVIFDDGARFSGRAAVGLGWYAATRFAVVVELGGEYGFNPAGDIDAWQLTPTLGAEAHL